MGYTIKELPKSERPRERLVEKGLESLSESELLALIIRTGLHGKNAKEVGNNLLKDMSLKKLSKASIQELKQYEGIGSIKAAQIAAAFELGRRKGLEKPEKILSSEDAKKLFEGRLIDLQQEELHAAYISPNNKVLSVDKIFKGSMKNVPVEKREVIKKGLECNASAVVLAHNHPLGNSDPTQKDIETTKVLQRALNEFKISLLDHIVVGESGAVSMKEKEIV